MKYTEQLLKIGVIGCGNIAQTFHLPILKYQNQVEVLWLVDTNTSNLKKAASLFPAAHQTTDMKAIEGIDAVIIATPPALHFEHVKFALMKSWNVLVEKPLATNFNDAGTLVTLAQQKNLTLCVNLNRRFLPHIKILKDIISTKPFGDIKKIKIFDGGRSIGNIEGEGGQTFHSSLTLSGGGGDA